MNVALVISCPTPSIPSFRNNPGGDESSTPRRIYLPSSMSGNAGNAKAKMDKTEEPLSRSSYLANT